MIVKPLCDYNGIVKEMQSGDSPPEVRVIEIVVFGIGEAVESGNGKAFFIIPPSLDYHTLVGFSGQSLVKGTAGFTSVQLRRDRPGMIVDEVDLLTTLLTIETAFHTDNAVICADGDEVVRTGDVIYIDVDIARTGGESLVVMLEFEKL